MAQQATEKRQRDSREVEASVVPTDPRRVDTTGDRADINDSTLSLDQERRKSLRHGEHSPEVDVEHPLASFNINVQGGHDIPSSGIIDEVVQCAAGVGPNRLDRGEDTWGRGDIQRQQRHIGKVLKRRHLGRRASRRKYMQAAFVKGFNEG